MGDYDHPHRTGGGICCPAHRKSGAALRELVARHGPAKAVDLANRRGVQAEDADDLEAVIRDTEAGCWDAARTRALGRSAKATESSQRTAGRKRSAAVRASGGGAVDQSYLDSLVRASKGRGGRFRSG